MAEQTIQVQYRSWKVFERDCKQQLSMKGLFLKTDLALAQFVPVVIQLVTPDGDAFDCPAEVIQCIAGQGLAVQFTEASVLQSVVKKCDESHPAEEIADASKDPSIGVPASIEAPTAEDEDKSAARAEQPLLAQQIEAMTVAEKRQSALHGRKDIRMLLIRDRNKTIHPFVVKNPGITLDEIEQIAKMPSVNPDVLRLIAANKEWNHSTTVCRNLVRNPQTPMKEALVLLDKLPLSEVRALAKSSSVRTAIQQVARKKVTG